MSFQRGDSGQHRNYYDVPVTIYTIEIRETKTHAHTDKYLDHKFSDNCYVKRKTGSQYKYFDGIHLDL
jgi:hypothetical protein